MAWFSIDDAEAQERLLAAWPDAPLDREEVLGMMLDVAKDQVIAFAPDENTNPDVPDKIVTPKPAYEYAQLQQAINLWNAGRVDSSGQTGMDTYTFTPRPLDKTIRQIIRPMQGVPSV